MTSYSINKIRKNIVEELSTMERGIKKILNDKSKTKDDRKDMAQHATEGVFSKINSHIDEMINNQAAWRKKAQEKYEASQNQDMTVLRTRAAVLIPALANAKDAELLSLFESRAGNRIDREIIGQLIQVRADMKPGEGDINPLAEKFNQIDADTVELLPESEQAALKELQHANSYYNYVEAAAIEGILGFEKIKRSIEGNAIEGLDSVKLRASRHILDSMDAGKTFKPGTLTIEMTEGEGVKEAFNSQQRAKEKQYNSAVTKIDPTV